MDKFVSSQPAAQEVHHDFSWDILRFILEGRSPIDLSALALLNRGEAHQFLLHYGFNMDILEDREILRDIFAESLSFIKSYFLSGTKLYPQPLSMPNEIERINDCRDLLVWASTGHGTERQAWSCAVLRVMHTINHLENTARVEFFPEIKRQILDRFRQNIHQDENNNPVLGQGPLSVSLAGVTYKEEKSRDSLIIKLLHKPKNVAEKIHDRLGVKLITHTKLDALKALRYLRQNNIIMFANLTPERSRNSLICLDAFRSLYEKISGTLNDLSEEDRERKVIELMREYANSIAPPKMENTHNNFSSIDFRSIQFTCQQLVRLENPGYFKARRMRVQLEKYQKGPELENLLLELEGPGAEKEIRMLFPLEVQIIDKENYILSIEGPASHDDYKRRQQEAACNRVMGPVYKLRFAAGEQ